MVKYYYMRPKKNKQINMYCKVIELVQSKDEGPSMFPYSLEIMSPHQSAKSLLVLWVEAQEPKYPEVVEEEEIIEEEMVPDHSIPGSNVGDYSGPNKRTKCPWILREGGHQGLCPPTGSEASLLGTPH